MEDHYFFVWWYTLLFFPWQNYAFPQLKILLQIVWHWHFVMIAGILDKIRYLIVHLTIIEKQTVQSIFRREINICSIIYILVSTVTNNRRRWLKNYTKFFVRIVSQSVQVRALLDSADKIGVIVRLDQCTGGIAPINFDNFFLWICRRVQATLEW